MKILEIKKTKFKREVFFCGHRLLSFLRLWNILETIMKDIDWLVSYRSFRQRGIELPADCHLDWSARNELVDVRVGDLKRFWVSGEVPLEETPLVRYLRTGDETVVREYYELLSQLGGLAKETVEIGVAQSRKVFDSVRGLEYDQHGVALSSTSTMSLLMGIIALRQCWPNMARTTKYVCCGC